MQYYGWPDFGVPSTFESYFSVFEAYRELRADIDLKKPIILHCSAGVGRTGTFLLIDLFADFIAHEAIGMAHLENVELNPPALLKQLRMQRPGLVQTKVSSFVFALIT